jgi:geranylgeranylglycerol-phosphate geranylgeranyltransferase
MRIQIGSLKAFSELVRLEHGIMYGIGVFIGAILSGWNLTLSTTLIIGFLAAVLSEFGAFALNDYFDIEADIANRRRDRPIVRKEVSPDAAFLIAAVGFILANVISFVYLNQAAFIVVLALTVLSVLYNTVLKHLPFVGNLFIAVTMAVPFLFGGLLLGGISGPAICLSSIAFFVGVGREVMKDIEDTAGDRKTGAKTLPIVMGSKGAASVAVMCYLLSVAMSIVPAFLFFSEKTLYLIVLATDYLLLNVALKLSKDQSLKTLRWGRKQTLYAIAIGLVAFLLASL